MLVNKNYVQGVVNALPHLNRIKTPTSINWDFTYVYYEIHPLNETGLNGSNRDRREDEASTLLPHAYSKHCRGNRVRLENVRKHLGELSLSKFTNVQISKQKQLGSIINFLNKQAARSSTTIAANFVKESKAKPPKACRMCTHNILTLGILRMSRLK